MADTIIRVGGETIRVVMQGGGGGGTGAAGPSNNTRATLADLKAANISDLSSIYDGYIWMWRMGDYTGQADDISIVASDDHPLSEGAWVKTESESGAEALQGVKTFNIDDYGAIGNSTGVGTTGADNSAALNAALAAVKAAGGGTLVVPAGGIYRVAQPMTLVDFSGLNIQLDGDIFFSDTTVGFWGRLFVDGLASSGGRIVGFSLTGFGRMFGVPNLHTTGQFDSGGTYIVPGLPNGGGPGYGGEDCVLTMRAVTGFRVADIDIGYSPNYVVSGLDIALGVFDNMFVHHGTAAIQCQDGTTSVRIQRCHGYDTSDDIFAFGYWGDRNRDVAILDCVAARCGARGLVAFAQDGVMIARNQVRDTFLASILVECSNYFGDRVLDDIAVIDNSITNGGMYDDAPYGRGVDVAAGIRVNVGAGYIAKLIVTGNRTKNIANSHFTTEGAGNVRHLILADNIFDGIGRIISAGNEIPAAAGGGLSVAPADNYFPAIKINNVERLHAHDNQVVGAHEDGIYVSPIAKVANVHDNQFEKLNGQIDGTPPFPSVTAVISDAYSTLASNNLLFDSPASSILYEVANQTLPATGAIIPRTSVTVSDNFNRANVAPVNGGLGNTSTGGKTWVGNPAGIAGNQTYFGASTNQGVVFDSGTPNVDISCTITITAAGQRLLARANSANVNTGARIVFDSGGNLFYFDGTTVAKTATFATVPPGVHTLRLMVIDNAAFAYVDGGNVANLKADPGVPFPVTNFVGFQDNSAGLGRFDDFTFAPVPAAIVIGKQREQTLNAYYNGAVPIGIDGVYYATDAHTIQYTVVVGSTNSTLSKIGPGGTTTIDNTLTTVGEVGTATLVAGDRVVLNKNGGTAGSVAVHVKRV